MELTYYGRTCVRIRSREATIAYDPYTSIVGPTGRGMSADIVTLSHPDDAPLSRVKGRLAPRDNRTPIATSLDSAVILEGPGEYEVKSVLITGIRSYRDEHRGPAARHNTVFAASMSKSIAVVALREAKYQRAASTPISSSSSSSVMNVPARFDMLISTPSRTNRTQATRSISTDSLLKPSASPAFRSRATVPW